MSWRSSDVLAAVTRHRACQSSAFDRRADMELAFESHWKGIFSSAFDMDGFKQFATLRAQTGSQALAARPTLAFFAVI